MLEHQNYIHGIFVKELENRFRCIVNIAGKDTVCYMPSSCKLEKLIPLRGKQVLLLPTQKSTTCYSVYAVKIRNSYCLLNLNHANHIVFHQIKRKIFGFLGNRRNVSLEKTISGYKSDLFIQDTNTLIEIKTVISLKQTAVFSSIYSERATQQLEKLAELLSCGYKVVYLVVALNPTISTVRLDKNSAIYSQLQKCLALGMQIYGISLHTKNQQIEVFRSITIEV